MSSGDRIAAWAAPAGQTPTTAFATFKRANADQFGPFCYEFASTPEQNLSFQDIFPAAYAGGGLTFKIHWAATNTNTGDAQFDLSLQRLLNATDTFGTLQNGGVAGPGTVGEIAIVTVTFTDGQLPGGLVAGDLWRVKVAKNTIGTYSGNPQLLGIEVLET